MTLQATVRTDLDSMRRVLGQLDRRVYAVDTGHGLGLTTEESGGRTIAEAGPVPIGRLGSSAFRARHGVLHGYVAGAMAAGIASEDMVIALARAGFLGSFGAAGLLPERVEWGLRRFAAEIPGLPFAANLIHSPHEQALERSAVDLYLRYGVRCVEASAFMDLTPHVVRYRVSGLGRAADGSVIAANRVIAKVSRPEVAEKFLRPAPEAIVAGLVADRLITVEQAALARQVPMADDITVEADSGGHTDRRPLVALFPVIARMRDAMPYPVGLGAAGGIGTPAAVAGAFTMGADYVVTGSVNQSCVEAGTSDPVRRLLCDAGIADCGMAPAADMFELGVELQVLRRGTLFPMRARQLAELYRRYDGLHALPAAEKEKLERHVLRQPLDQVWAQVEEYFTRRDPGQVERAAADPKRRMALVFRWYLGMSTRWATTGDAERVSDYQIWCGPAIGAFNEWVRGTALAAPENRRVADVATHLMRGAAYTLRVQQLALAGVRLPAACREYRP